MADKEALEMAYDAGQAAQRDHLREDVCPFPPDSEESDAWHDGYVNDLHEKWLPAGGQDLRAGVTD